MKMLSVIIPTFNRAQTLARALSSVYAQVLPGVLEAIEVIVIDDGSTDSTRDLVASQFPQAHYYAQENRGVSAARNRGISAASGEWIALLDSDDEWLPGKLQAQFELLDQSHLLVCHADEIWVRNDVRVNPMNKHRKRGGQIFTHCLPLCAMSPSSIIIHRSVFEDVGNFNEALPACEDYDLWLRIAARFEVAFVERACIRKYGGHDDQLSRQYWGMDRFRVIALENCLTDSHIRNHLTSDMYSAARSMLIKKLTILKNGARKHENQALLDECRRKLSVWSESYDEV